MIGKALGNTRSLEFIQGVPKNGPVLLLQLVLEVFVFRHTICPNTIWFANNTIFSKDNTCLVQ